MWSGLGRMGHQGRAGGPRDGRAGGGADPHPDAAGSHLRGRGGDVAGGGRALRVGGACGRGEGRVRIPTPQAPTSEAVVETSLEVIGRFGWDGPVGVGFPGVIKDGVVHTAANVAKELIGFDLQGRLQREVGNTVRVVNDADAAGLAEMRWGAGRGVEGMVMMLTLGTGIGTALFTQGKLMPNSEFGHLMIRNREAELRASDRIRKQEDLSWKQWAKRLNEYLATLESLFWPDLIIVGGGGRREAARRAASAAGRG